MRSRVTNWYEVAIRYDKTMEDGLQKKISEYYVVDALSFGKAEEIITEEMSSYISGEFEVKNITPAAFHEVYFSDNDNDDRWYKAKVSYIDFDEKTEKEKRTTVTYLVQAGSFNGAVKNMEEAMKGSLRDFAVVNISETKFMDVYERKD